MLRRILFTTLCIATSASGAANAQPSKYVVDHVRLGASVNSDVKNHDCDRSDDFLGFVWCHQEAKNANNHVSKTIMYEEQSGAAVYVMRNEALVLLDQSRVEKEINILSKIFQESPVVNWMPTRKGAPKAVIALWGQVRVEELNPDALSMLAARQSAHQGVIVDYMGDLYRSARNGLPVYRMIGGAGYLYSASFGAGERGHQHYVAIDASRFGRPDIAQPPQPTLPGPSMPGSRETYAPKPVPSAAFIGVETFDLSKRANIVIVGDIWSGDGERFKQAVIELIRRGYWIGQVKTFSRGGDIAAALFIGHQIRLLRASTAAPNISATPDGIRTCHTSLVPGGAIYFNSYSGGDANCDCASACFFIWAAGSGREGDVIGVHRMWYSDFASKSTQEARRMYDDVIKRATAYLQQMGIPENIVRLTFSTSSVDLRYLTAQELAPMLGFPPGIEELKIARCGPHPNNNMPESVRLAYYNCTEAIQAEDSRTGAEEYIRAFTGAGLGGGAAGVNLPVPTPGPPITLLESSFLSRWAIDTLSNCNVPSKSYSLKFDDGNIIWRDGTGKIDVESVVFRAEMELRTITVRSIHPNGRGEKAGTTWSYSSLGKDRILVKPGGRDAFRLARCPS